MAILDLIVFVKESMELSTNSSKAT